MIIQITHSVWGFTVKIQTPDPDLRGYAVDALKNFIPKHTRRYNPANRTWFVHLRAEKRLKKWTATLQGELSGVEIQEIFLEKAA